MKKTWLIDDGDSFKSISTRGFRPKKAIGEVPKDPITGRLEHPSWLVVESVEVSDGVFEDKISVDQVKKDLVISDIEQKKSEKKVIRSTELKAYRKLKKRIKQLNKSDLNSSQGIKDAIMDLVTAIKIIEEKLWNINENEEDQ
jgi:hypothetical protein